MVSTNVLLLADGRFPSGGHAHSGGLEAAVVHKRVSDLDSLFAFLGGRLATTGLVSAAFTAAACHRAAGDALDLDELEFALAARTPSKALRHAARKQGRSLCRAAKVVWPSAVVSAAAAYPCGVSHPVALGVVAHAAGMGVREAAGIMAYQTVGGPASAAIRLLGMDPYAVNALLARLAAACDAVADKACGLAGGPVAELPAASAPLLEISAEDHASWEVRLFAS